MQLVALRSKSGLRGPGRSPSNSDLLLRHPSLLSSLRTTTTQRIVSTIVFEPHIPSSSFLIRWLFPECPHQPHAMIMLVAMKSAFLGLKCIELGVKWSKSGLDKKVGAGQAKAEPWSTYYSAWQTQLDPIKHPKWLQTKVFKSCSFVENCCTVM